jgi:hypothetical protein
VLAVLDCAGSVDPPGQALLLAGLNPIEQIFASSSTCCARPPRAPEHLHLPSVNCFRS